MSTSKLSKLLHSRPRKSPPARMDTAYDLSTVHSLWTNVDIEKLLCFTCKQPITHDHVLARTFKLSSKHTPPATQPHSEILTIPSLSTSLLLFTRHLACLQSSAPYVAVSHVWHSSVAELQYKHTAPPDRITAAAKTLLETPTRICLALASLTTPSSESLEVWHDYISVPQWQPALKTPILAQIPRIFNGATSVLLHLSDVDIRSFHMMRHGSSPQEIARGISNICNSHYFSRMWTAMEYTQARHSIRILTRDYAWAPPSENYPFLVSELTRRWDILAEAHGSPKVLEQMVGMGYNLVPWQLGPLQTLRDLNASSTRRATFAVAYDLLSRRAVTLERDLFHALLGTLRLGDVLSVAELDADTDVALRQVARHCLLAGDLSPLFMVPASAQRPLDDNALQRYGYTDTLTWGLGDELAPPTHVDDIEVGSSETAGGDVVTLTAETVGTVSAVRREAWSFWDEKSVFHSNLKIALESLPSLSDTTALVNTLCARLYGLPPAAVHARLTSPPERLPTLLEDIKHVYNAYPHRLQHVEDRIAETLALSTTEIHRDVSPMASLAAYAGSIHLGGAVALLTILCSSCHSPHLLRCALLRPASSILGARAVRIPGLRYFAITNAGGGGFLLDSQDRVVGRFVWGTPTCGCAMLGRVRVRVEGVMRPRRNAFVYGSAGEKAGEWLPLAQEGRVKFR